MASIKGGDSIHLIPRAMYVGWVNFVEEAEIEIMGSPKSLHIGPLRRIGTEAKGVYRALDAEMGEIRILRLHPGAENTEIRCSLEYASLFYAELIGFEALSYCWGDQTKHQTVKIVTTDQGGEATAVDITITESLYFALHGLRSHEGVRTLWIDALCINQRDIDERNHQVSVMQQIYSKAQRVVIWLGKEYLQFTESIGQIQGFLRLRAGDREKFDSNLSLEKPHGFEGFEQYQYSFMARIFNNPWFSRVWVIQEAVNATSTIVKCGKHEIAWPILLRFNKCLIQAMRKTPAIGARTMPETISKLIDVKVEHNELVVFKKAASDHLEVIVTAIDLCCTDPRDKIFAIIQLISPDQGKLPNALKADYRKPTIQVFTDFTRHWIRESQSLRILSTIHADLGRSWQRMTGQAAHLVCLDHPTWSFWYTGNSNWAKNTLGFDNDCTYRASGGTKPEIEVLDSSRGNELRLSGVQIGMITQIKPFMHHGMENMQPALRPETMQAFEDIFDPWAKHDSWKPNTNLLSIKDARAVQNAQQLHPRIHFTSNMREGDAKLTCLSDCLFAAQTRSGWTELGLCPHSAQVGDVVVVLLGGNVPFLLRPVLNTSQEKAYYLIGEAFCQGYMDGNAISEMNSGSLKKEIFTLI
ncbi:heterokaryon incompatibility protein-domain-containing protein [Xylariaceae sp. FL0255]|nr:heterokaryon incompatibility protein-domain-containing protein [Xylariaceae sp. FL0255]